MPLPPMPMLVHGDWLVYELVEPEPGRFRYEYTARHGLTGETHELDVSSNCRCQVPMILAMIDLGFPRRGDLGLIGPITPEDVITMLRQRAGAVAA